MLALTPRYFTKWHFSLADSLINKWIRFQTAIENRFLILSAECPPVLRLSFFSLLCFSFSLSLFILAVLHLSAELGGSWTERMLGYVKVTRASCHPSLRFPLSSSIIEPLNQATLHTGDMSECVCVRVCARRYGQGYSFLSVIYSSTAQRSWPLYRTCVLYWWS